MKAAIPTLYIAIGLLGGFAIGRASYAMSVNDSGDYLVVISTALLMLVLVAVSVVIQARARRAGR